MLSLWDFQATREGGGAVSDLRCESCGGILVEDDLLGFPYYRCATCGEVVELSDQEKEAGEE